MKVWVVGQGEYSDAHAVGVLSFEEAAKRAAQLLKDGWYNEFELDDKIVTEDRPGMLFFGATIYLNPDRIWIRQADPAPEQFYDFSRAPDWYTPKWRPYLYASFWARDHAHAEKIAVEKRQAWLRETGWIG